MLLKLRYDGSLFKFAFNLNLRRYTTVASPKVGQCRLTVSKPVFKAPMVSALETIV